MCYTFIYYYPRVPQLLQCFSSPTIESLRKFHTSLVKYLDSKSLFVFDHLNIICLFYFVSDGLLPSYVTSDKDNFFLYTNEIYDHLLNVTEFSNELGQRYSEFYGSPNQQVAFCGVSAQLKG